jgi:radical SAM protein with 4Fe4S-binding SPASM domain
MPSLLRRALHPLYRRLETRVHPLRYLFVEITQRCNLDCRHCGSDCGRSPNLDELSVQEWLAFFSYLRTTFDTRRLMLVVTGGEPLCHPELDVLAEGLAANRLAWGMVTNGWSLTAERLRTLRRHRLVSATVSLDGLAPSHDWLRGREGSFDRALHAIELCAAAGLPAFDVVTCVSPRNLAELDDVAALLRNAGVRNWRLFSIFPKGRAQGNRELLLDDSQLGTLLQWIANERSVNGSREWQVSFSCEGYLPGTEDRVVRDEPYFCRAGICIGSVLCDGAIGACPNISRKLVQGNIRNDDFKQVWETAFAPFRNRSWMRAGPCERCPQWRRCQGNSLHLWDETTGTTARCYLDAVKRWRCPPSTADRESP